MFVVRASSDGSEYFSLDIDDDNHSVSPSAPNAMNGTFTHSQSQHTVESNDQNSSSSNSNSG